jgi:predicted nucleic acid-binding protein
MTAISPWIELSLSERRRPRKRRQELAALLAGVLLAGLALSALRVHVTELRYRRAEALQEEQRLLDQQRQLTVDVQGRRDPMRLQELARAQGFVSPERVIDLPVRTASR